MGWAALKAHMGRAVSMCVAATSTLKPREEAEFRRIAQLMLMKW